MVRFSVLMLWPIRSSAINMDTRDYVMFVDQVHGPLTSKCGVCAEIVCVPHVIFSHADDYHYDYFELGCKQVALNRNTPSESAFLGYWNVTELPPIVRSMGLMKRGATFHLYVDGRKMSSCLRHTCFMRTTPVGTFSATVLLPQQQSPRARQKGSL